MQKLTPADLDALEAAYRRYGETWGYDNEVHFLADEHLPALIAAARATVPEPIGEKHRDGGVWQVWEAFYERWVIAKWREQSEMWRRLDGGDVIAPTYALPLPPAPEETDA
jgi:hypothetical protein